MKKNKGKSTLLDVLALRKKTGRITGEILINGKPLTNDTNVIYYILLSFQYIFHIISSIIFLYDYLFYIIF